jgi:hypothetical protein
MIRRLKCARFCWPDSGNAPRISRTRFAKFVAFASILRAHGQACQTLYCSTMVSRTPYRRLLPNPIHALTLFPRLMICIRHSICHTNVKGTLKNGPQDTIEHKPYIPVKSPIEYGSWRNLSGCQHVREKTALRANCLYTAS